MIAVDVGVTLEEKEEITLEVLTVALLQMDLAVTDVRVNHVSAALTTTVATLPGTRPASTNVQTTAMDVEMQRKVAVKVVEPVLRRGAHQPMALDVTDADVKVASVAKTITAAQPSGTISA